MHENGPRRLAAAVIMRAIKDVHGHVDGATSRKRAVFQEDAKRFLDPSNEQFQFYCDMVDLDPDALYEAIRRNGDEWMETPRASALV